jgi:hypothetical protein
MVYQLVFIVIFLSLSMCKEMVKGIFIPPIKVTQYDSSLLVCLGCHGYMMDLQTNSMLWFGKINFTNWSGLSFMLQLIMEVLFHQTIDYLTIVQIVFFL